MVFCSIVDCYFRASPNSPFKSRTDTEQWRWNCFLRIIDLQTYNHDMLPNC